MKYVTVIVALYPDEDTTNPKYANYLNKNIDIYMDIFYLVANEIVLINTL